MPSETATCGCGEPFVSNEDGWLTCARGHYERTPESRAEMAETSRQPQELTPECDLRITVEHAKEWTGHRWKERRNG
ncbi:MAG TPA: hypothetical protein VK595_11155 [Vicinamibacterales bacterium]|nr:hypothetical protein [Vicinamibacterales bacterium]